MGYWGEAFEVGQKSGKSALEINVKCSFIKINLDALG